MYFESPLFLFLYSRLLSQNSNFASALILFGCCGSFYRFRGLWLVKLFCSTSQLFSTPYSLLQAHPMSILFKFRYSDYKSHRVFIFFKLRTRFGRRTGNIKQIVFKKAGARRCKNISSLENSHVLYKVHEWTESLKRT